MTVVIVREFNPTNTGIMLNSICFHPNLKCIQHMGYIGVGIKFNTLLVNSRRVDISIKIIDVITSKI